MKKRKKKYVPKCVYMIGIFKKPAPGTEDFEMHTIMWCSKLRDAEHYLELAGREVKGKPGVYWDDPFECRWSHAVIEKVQEHRFPVPEVMSWWGSRRSNGHGSCAHKLKGPPRWFPTKQTFGFTFPT